MDDDGHRHILDPLKSAAMNAVFDEDINSDR